MTRRSFLSTLASLPIIGRFFAPANAPTLEFEFDPIVDIPADAPQGMRRLKLTFFGGTLESTDAHGAIPITRVLVNGEERMLPTTIEAGDDVRAIVD